MNRRDFIKSLVLVPTIVAAGKVRMSLESNVLYHNSNAYTSIWYGGAAGGGKTERLYGMMYHDSFPQREWLGLSRS